MNGILKYTAMAACLTFGFGATAKANTVTIMISESAIAAALAGQGVYAVYAVGVDNTFTSFSNATGTFSGVATPVASWSQVTLSSTAFGTALDSVGAAPGTAGSNPPTGAFLSQAASPLTGTYTADNVNGTGKVYASSGNTTFYNAGTTLGFVFNSSTAIANGATGTIGIDIAYDTVAAGGTQNSVKGNIGFFNVTGTAMVTATPEPSSIVLLFGGIATLAIGSSRRRLRA